MNRPWSNGAGNVVLAALAGVTLALTGCSRPIPGDALIVAQSPRSLDPGQARSELDLRYPTGSRIVLATTEPQTRVLGVLSAGLAAAADPVLSWDGRRVVFSGKSSTKAEWQIYEADLRGGRCRPLTAMAGGAQNPALLPDGRLLFVSPVPPPGMASASARVPALYVQGPDDGKPRQLTYSSAGVADPTVLLDGRILLVMNPAGAGGHTAPGSALYTINNDGTEIAAFAGQHDAPSFIHRPRQLADGRIAFIAGDDLNGAARAEVVLSARPFQSRTPLFNVPTAISAVEPGPNGDLLVCGKRPGNASPCGVLAVFRLRAQALAWGRPVLEDPDWNSTAAVQAGASRRPMGRLSNVEPSHRTGQLLCLNVNDSTVVPAGSSQPPSATRVRVFTSSPGSTQRTLGEVEVQPDGSFMAEVPADLPLGFEALNERGQVLRREPALVWVRPGENRACIGCHERHNHSPRNRRPLAVRVPVPKLGGGPAELVKNGN